MENLNSNPEHDARKFAAFLLNRERNLVTFRNEVTKEYKERFKTELLRIAKSLMVDEGE